MTTPTIYPNDELLSIPEVAKACGVVALTARVWALRGRIPAREIGNRLVVRRVDLDAFLAKRPKATEKAEA